MEQRTYKALDMTSPAAQKALARCKASKPRVHVVNLEAGLFSVPSRRGNGETYVIRLFITPNGKCLHECTCPGAKANQLCVHVVGCFLVWGGIVAARQEAERLAAVKAISAVDGSGWVGDTALTNNLAGFASDSCEPAKEEVVGGDSRPSPSLTQYPTWPATDGFTHECCAICNGELEDGVCLLHPNAPTRSLTRDESIKWEREQRQRDRDGSVLSKPQPKGVRFNGALI